MRPTPNRSTRRATLLFALACLASVLLVLGAYSNSLDNAFHFDDSHVVEENIFIRDLRNIPRFFVDARTFSSIPTNATYRPIVSTTLALDYATGRGLAPRAFHVTQLALLLAVGALLAAVFFVVLRSLGPSPWHRWTALLAATFFCIHTGNTQPVNYISARSELLAAIGILGALWVYASAPRARRFQLHLLPMAFGVLAKSPAVIAAPLLLAYDLLIARGLPLRDLFARRARPDVRAALRSTAPAFAAAIALYLFVEGMNPPGQTYGGGGRLRYLLTETWVWVHYARLFALPTGLSADTDLQLFERALDPRVFAGIALALGLAALAWFASQRREGRVAAFGIVWFAIGLFPSSTVFPLAEVANDHRIFFPFAGLSLTVASWLALRLESGAGPGRSRAAIAATLAVALIAAHAAGTHARNRVWRSEETLWADVVRKNPGNGRGWMNYGLTQMQLGRHERARDLFREAAARLPNYATLETNLAIVENALGRPAAADSHFTRALALAPEHPAPHRYYARWLIRQGRAGEAVPHLVRTLELSPADIEARHMLMDLYAARGARELAPLAIETLSFASNDTAAERHARGEPPFRADAPTAASWFALGSGLIREERFVDAAQAYRAGLALAPSNADARNDLGWSLAKLGFFEEAAPEFRRAQRGGDARLAAANLAWAEGEIADARYKRAYALQRTGRARESIPIYESLLDTYPRWTNAHYNLAHALMTSGRFAEAADEFRRTLELEPGMSEARMHLAACVEKAAAGAATAAN